MAFATKIIFFRTFGGYFPSEGVQWGGGKKKTGNDIFVLQIW
jgi:hypothetical protein